MTGGEIRSVRGVATVKLDHDSAAVRHGVTGVDGEVEQCQLDLVGVDLHGRKRRRQFELHLDGGTDRALQEVGHATHEGGEIDRAWLERLSAGEGEKTLREGGASLGTLQGAVE